MAIIGLDIGGTKILGAFFDKKGRIIDREKKTSKGEKGFEFLLKQICKVIDELKRRNNQIVKGIGIGVPGIVNKKGIIKFTPNLPIKDFDIASYLKNRYDVAVKVGNDVNLGTLGECSELDIPHDNVIGLFPGTGLGGGIVIDGKLYVGQGYAGELGHIVVEKNGIKCGCGNYGCLESYASKKGIISYIAKELDNGRDSILKEDVLAGVIKSSKLKKAFDQNDVLVTEAMEQFVEYLGMGVGIIMNIFNPNLVIIGGGIIDAFGESLLEDINQHAKAYAMQGIFENTIVRKSKLGDDAVVYGGYYLTKI